MQHDDKPHISTVLETVHSNPAPPVGMRAVLHVEVERIVNGYMITFHITDKSWTSWRNPVSKSVAVHVVATWEEVVSVLAEAKKHPEIVDRAAEPVIRIPEASDAA